MSSVQCDLANLPTTPNMRSLSKLIYLGVFLRHTPRVDEGIILMHFHINSTFPLESFPPCLTLNCMALQFVPLPAVMNMVLWEEKIETRPSLGGWLGLALPRKAIARCKRWRSAIKTRIRFAINSSLDEDCNHIKSSHKQTIMPVREKHWLDLNLWPGNSRDREILCSYHSSKLCKV